MQYALTFLAIAIITGYLGFVTMAGPFALMAKVSFLLCLVAAIVAAVD